MTLSAFSAYWEKVPKGRLRLLDGCRLLGKSATTNKKGDVMPEAFGVFLGVGYDDMETNDSGLDMENQGLIVSLGLKGRMVRTRFDSGGD